MGFLAKKLFLSSRRPLQYAILFPFNQIKVPFLYIENYQLCAKERLPKYTFLLVQIEIKSLKYSFGVVFTYDLCCSAMTQRIEKENEKRNALWDMLNIFS